jgi:hypothetical protein
MNNRFSCPSGSSKINGVCSPSRHIISQVPISRLDPPPPVFKETCTTTCFSAGMNPYLQSGNIGVMQPAYQETLANGFKFHEMSKAQKQCVEDCSNHPSLVSKSTPMDIESIKKQATTWVSPTPVTPIIPNRDTGQVVRTKFMLKSSIPSW